MRYINLKMVESEGGAAGDGTSGQGNESVYAGGNVVQEFTIQDA